jgi:magnesium transporter
MRPTDREAAPERRGIRRLFDRRKTRPGAAPGTIVVDREAPAPLIRLIAYAPDRFEEQVVSQPAELQPWLDGWPVVWINVDGLGSERVLQDIAEMFQFHRLVLEDIVNVHQRPKVEEYDDRLFLVARATHLDGALDTEQVSMMLGSRVLLTFQERVGDCLDPVRTRLRKGSGKLRERGPDYLAYTILDAILDANFPILERYGELLEDVEDETLTKPDHGTAARIHDIKRDLFLLRRTIWPMREMFGHLLRESNPLIGDPTKVYLRDCYDHSVQLMDILESYREVASGLMEVYLSSLSHRMNEVMRVLTIIATIFIPLTFIVGLYGMNFDRASSPWNMPELGWYWGYPLCLLLMAAVAIGMLLWFRRLGWIGRRGER